MEIESIPPRRYVWPWFVAFALVIGILLAVLWMRAEIQRAKERQNYCYDIPIANSAAPLLSQNGSQFDAGGVRLHVAVETNIISLGWPINIHCRLTNAMTNAVILRRPVWGGTFLFLTNRSGHGISLTPLPDAGGSFLLSQPVKPGEIFEWLVQWPLSETNRIGDYRLHAAREIVFPNGESTVIFSDPVKINIVAGRAPLPDGKSKTW